ncbi:helix-turn-helix domain-containing protein [Planctomycetota bacterium]
MDRWLSVDEIAEYLGIKRDTVYKWISQDRMPAHKVGRLWKFKAKEVDQWVRNPWRNIFRNDVPAISKIF